MIEKACQGRHGRQVPRPVPGRLVPGRRRHLDQHERQRSARQRRRSSSAGTRRASTNILEPHDDLNMSQSTNDSYPTAIKVALILRNDKLIAELEKLSASFRAKGNAVPEDREDGPHRAAGRRADDGRPGVPRLRRGARGRDPAAAGRGEVPLRASTWARPRSAPGINVPKGYAEKCAAHLAKLTGKPIVMAADMIAATWDQQGFVVYSSALKSVGDQAGEDLERPDPARLRAARGTGRDQPAGDPAGLVDHAGQGQPGGARGGRHRRVPGDGQRLRRHARRPQRAAPAQRLRAARRASPSIESQHLLYNVSKLFRTKCVDGITVNEKVLEHYMETTVGIVTALNPVLGYDKATELAKEALARAARASSRSSARRRS